MKPELLRKRVEIQNPPPGNDHSVITGDWTTEATVWASIEPVSVKEVSVAARYSDTVSHKVVMRFRRLSPLQRLKFGDRIFAIDGVHNVNEAREMLIVFCTELVDR
jgi:SPP1 family predicted phage head-tail adaptor